MGKREAAMDILRNKTQGFTIIKNGILKDSRINMRDRGLYVTLCSLPDGWELSVRGLTAILPDGKSAIAASLNSLESAGYLLRRPRKTRGRIVGREWEITAPEKEIPEEKKEQMGNAVLINKTQGFTIVKNNIMRDQNLPLKDRGLLVTLLGLPDGWKMSINGLAEILPDGRAAVGKGIQMLENLGYLTRTQLREEDGKWTGSVWEVRDIPEKGTNETDCEKQTQEIEKENATHEEKSEKTVMTVPDCREIVIQRMEKPEEGILRTENPDKEIKEPDDSS